MLLNYHHECNERVHSRHRIGKDEQHVNSIANLPDRLGPSRGHVVMSSNGRVVAAIDIGSNTLKLTVASVSGGKVTPIYGTAQVVRLSADLSQTGRLRQDRMQHAIEVLREFGTIAHDYGARQVIAVATAATRSAANGPEFLARVKDEAGIDIDVITGGEEARLTTDGVLTQIDPTGMILIVDIGGASTELIAVRDGITTESASLAMGSGILTDRFVASDPPHASELDHVEQETSRLASSFLDHHDAVDRLVLVGGVGMYLYTLLGKAGYIEVSALDEAREIVLGKTAAELAPVITAPVVRARVLPAGFAIARSICRLSGATQIEAVANGLRIGILLRIAASEVQEESPR